MTTGGAEAAFSTAPLQSERAKHYGPMKHDQGASRIRVESDRHRAESAHSGPARATYCPWPRRGSRVHSASRRSAGTPKRRRPSSLRWPALSAPRVSSGRTCWARYRLAATIVVIPVKASSLGSQSCRVQKTRFGRFRASADEATRRVIRHCRKAPTLNRSSRTTFSARSTKLSSLTAAPPYDRVKGATRSRTAPTSLATGTEPSAAASRCPLLTLAPLRFEGLSHEALLDAVAFDRLLTDPIELGEQVLHLSRSRRTFSCRRSCNNPGFRSARSTDPAAHEFP